MVAHDPPLHTTFIATSHAIWQTPGENAVGPTIIKELQHEISWTSRRPLVCTNYDATSCYDWITLNLTSLASCAHGQNKAITLINATMLKEATFVLKTQLGTSDEHYSHTKLHPLYGIGHGAGNSPAVWAMISSTLFTLHGENAKGAA